MMIKFLQCLTLCLAIEKSLSDKMIKMNFAGGDDDIIRMRRDLVTDNCAENTKTMVDESIKCSRE